MKKSKTLGLSALCGLLLGAAGCHSKPAAPAEQTLPVARVRVLPVAEKKYQAAEEVVGTVRAKLHAGIEAKLSGRIETMAVVPGQKVKKGDLLVQLDRREIQAKLDQAKAVLEQTELDHQRVAALFKQEAISRQEFDLVQSRFRVATAAVAEAETLLSYARLTAPFDGIVSRKFADVGDLASPGRTLLEVEDPSLLRFEADVPEALIGRIETGAKLVVRVAPLTNELEAVVSEVAPVADPNSRTYLVKLDLPRVQGLRTGQFGRLAVPITETSTVRIPLSGLVRRGQMELVFVVRSQKAVLRLVKTGKRFGNEIEILSGLSVGESIVTDNPAVLVDGQPVEAQP